MKNWLKSKLAALWERIKAEETALGKFLVYVLGVGGGAAAIVGAGFEYLAGIPIDWIPENVKTYIVWGALIAGGIGKLTAKLPKQPNP